MLRQIAGTIGYDASLFNDIRSCCTASIIDVKNESSTIACAWSYMKLDGKDTKLVAERHKFWFWLVPGGWPTREVIKFCVS